jgi:hypothetical protein
MVSGDPASVERIRPMISLVDRHAPSRHRLFYLVHERHADGAGVDQQLHGLALSEALPRAEIGRRDP